MWTKAQRHEYLRFGVREAVPGNAQQALEQALRGGADKRRRAQARQGSASRSAAQARGANEAEASRTNSCDMLIPMR